MKTKRLMVTGKNLLSALRMLSALNLLGSTVDLQSLRVTKRPKLALPRWAAQLVVLAEQVTGLDGRCLGLACYPPLEPFHALLERNHRRIHTLRLDVSPLFDEYQTAALGLRQFFASFEDGVFLDTLAALWRRKKRARRK